MLSVTNPCRSNVNFFTNCSNHATFFGHMHQINYVASIKIASNTIPAAGS
jgi:hypothetical protein